MFASCVAKETGNNNKKVEPVNIKLDDYKNPQTPEFLAILTPLLILTVFLLLPLYVPFTPSWLLSPKKVTPVVFGRVE